MYSLKKFYFNYNTLLYFLHPHFFKVKCDLSTLGELGFYLESLSVNYFKNNLFYEFRVVSIQIFIQS